MKKINLIAVRTIAFLAIILVFVSFVKKDDDPVIDKIVSRLADWLDSNQPEKVYLQTDKPFYAAGDNIWFKAYITIGSDHKLSALSNVVNVELIDQRDSVTKWIKLPMVNGTAWGDIELPDTLREGNYRLRAYTNWMRNAGPAYYFDKMISVGNAITNTVFTKASCRNTSVDGQLKTVVKISYFDLNGIVYAGKPVDYNVQFNNKVISHGKGVTDNNGDITVDFINHTSAINGNVVTNIKLDNKSTQTKTVSITAATGKTDVQFFPESGSLIDGITSKVAFKAVGPDGLARDIKGTVIDNENNAVAAFTTRHLGMGIFLITPRAGKTYKALITGVDGSQSTVSLPVVLNSGYVMSIHESDSTMLRIKVTASNDLESSGQVYLLAQSGGQACFVAKNQPGKASFSVNLPKNKFPSGVAQFTLFTNTGEPLNERVIFIKNTDDFLNLKISSPKTVTVPREKVKIDLDVQNAANKSVNGSFSVSVIDESKLQSNESAETTILSHILLTSDIKGYIEQPNYYFINNDDTTRANLDILMLTQGYRRFEWKPLLSGNIPVPVYRPEKFIKLSGYVKTYGGKAVAAAKVNLFTSVAHNLSFLDTLADKDGHFVFNDMFLPDSMKFLLSAATPKNGKNVEIVLDDNGNEDKAIKKNNYITPGNNGSNLALANYLKAQKQLYNEELKYGIGNHMNNLNEVLIKGKRKTNIDYSSNLNGAGHANQVITGDQLNCAGDLATCLQGRILGVIFRDGKPYLTRDRFNRPMKIMLDGIPIDNLSQIMNSEIGSIEVLKDLFYTAVYGPGGSNGMLIITSKRVPDEKNNSSQGAMIYRPKGFYRAREFYSPQYDDPKTNQSVADLRTTIFWKPNIITDDKGHASFEYYNAGTPGIYLVTIEGVGVDGNLGRKTFTYKVQ